MNTDKATARAALDALKPSYIEAMKKGSGRAADKILQDALDQNIVVNDIYLELFQPTAYEIGRLWQRNEFTVAQEHLATAIIERQMGELHPLFRPLSEKSKTLVLGCVEQEMHRVGVRMVADFFEQDGWTVHYLGATVPTEHFIAMACEMDADLIGLSAHLIYTLPAVSEFIRELAKQGMDGIPVMAGGMALTQQPELAQALGVRFTARDARAAVHFADELFQPKLSEGSAESFQPPEKKS